MDFVQKLKDIIAYWNSLTKDQGGDASKPIMLMMDDLSTEHEKSYRLTIVKDDVIMFRRGVTYQEECPDQPYNVLAETLIDDVCFAGFSLILELQGRGTLTKQPYTN
jgi:hypothetical protein